MKGIILPALLVGICITLCSCNANTRNDLEELSKYSWIAPRSVTLVFEAKDEHGKNESDVIIEKDIEEQDSVPVFASLYEDGILTEENTSSVCPDTDIGITAITSDVSTGADSASDTKSVAEASIIENPYIYAYDENVIDSIPKTNDIADDSVKDSAAEPNTTEQSENQELYVWIPKSGKKFHSKAECSNMSGPSKVTLAEAEALGFTRCKRCY